MGRLVLAGSHPDLRVIRRPVDDKGKRKSEIPVDSVRELAEFFAMRPAMGGWRVAIIDAVDEMNRHGENAILKTLEEPPNRAVLFLISHGEQLLLPTVRSRCRVLRCGALGEHETMSALAMALACALLVPIGRRLVDLRVGAIAGGIAALSPHLIGHGQVVGHEAPSVAAWALAWWLAARVWDGGDRGRPLAWRLVAVGVVLGVALMIRFVNGLMAPAIGLTIVITAPAGARGRAVALGMAIIPAVAIITAIALWPRLWTHPIAHTEEAWAKLKGTHSLEPFHGALTKAPPRWYFVPYLGATTDRKSTRLNSSH